MVISQIYVLLIGIYLSGLSKSVTFLLVASNSTLQPMGIVNIECVWQQSNSAKNGTLQPFSTSHKISCGFLPVPLSSNFSCLPRIIPPTLSNTPASFNMEKLRSIVQASFSESSINRISPFLIFGNYKL